MPELDYEYWLMVEEHIALLQPYLNANLLCTVEDRPTLAPTLVAVLFLKRALAQSSPLTLYCMNERLRSGDQTESDCVWVREHHKLHHLTPEDPQLRLENSSRTHVRHAFVGMRTFPEGVCGIHERMRFTLNPCDAPHRPSDPPMWSDLPKTPKRLDTLRRSELVKKMVLLLKFWLAELVM